MATKKRLIDANVLKANFVVSGEFAKDLWHAGTIRSTIDDAPTVDAVEVVCSKWDTVLYERNGTLDYYSHICPECKYLYRSFKFKGHNYCPNCGADMRGETE